MSEMLYASQRRIRTNGAAAASSAPPFDAPTLLREQYTLLENATAREIHASYFLRLRLSAQQRRTAQRNQLSDQRAAWSGGARGAAPSLRNDEHDHHTEANALALHGSLYMMQQQQQQHQQQQLQQQQQRNKSPGVIEGATNNSLSNLCASSPEERRFMRSHFSSTPPSPPLTTPLEAQRLHSPQQSQVRLSLPQPAANPLDNVPASVAARCNARGSGSCDAAPAAWPSPVAMSARGRSSESVASGAAPSRAEAAPQAPDGPGVAEEPLRPCPHCGRRFFAVSRWPRHVAVCERQQATRPPPKAGSSTARLYDTRRVSQVSADEDGVGSSAPGRRTTGADQSLASSRRSREGPERKSSWRQKRAQMRQALQLGNDAQYTPRSTTSNGVPAEAFMDDRVLCPTCGRRFAQTAAERHIPFCKDRHGGLKSMRM